MHEHKRLGRSIELAATAEQLRADGESEKAPPCALKTVMEHLPPILAEESGLR
jgi:hypothetical protein